MTRSTLTRGAFAAPVLLAAWIAARLGQASTARLRYPFDLEWMEGGMLVHAWRLARGEPIYPAPSPDFIPMIYPPGYAWVVATLGGESGVGYGLGRSVSLFATVLAGLAIVTLAHRRHAHAAAGWVGAVVFWATWVHSGAFMDMVRPDSAFVCLLAWSTVAVVDRDRRGPLLGGLLLAASFLFKQNAALFGVPLLGAAWALHGTRAAVQFAAASIVPALTWLGAMQYATDGHFLRYLVEVPASHPVHEARAFPGSLQELGKALPATAACATVWMLWALSNALPQVPRHLTVWTPLAAGAAATWLWAFLPGVKGAVVGPPGAVAATTWIFGAALAATAIAIVHRARGAVALDPWLAAAGLGWTGWISVAWMRAHHGGFLNVYMPLHWIGGAACALMLTQCWNIPRRGPALATLAALCQLAWAHQYLDTERLVPTRADAAAGQRIVQALSQSEGPVLSPFAPWLAKQAGHDPSLHLIALWDVAGKKSPYPGMRDAMHRAVREQRWGTIVDAQRSMRYGARDNYEIERQLPVGPREFFPRTGWRQRPAVLLTPRRPSE